MMALGDANFNPVDPEIESIWGFPRGKFLLFGGYLDKAQGTLLNWPLERRMQATNALHQRHKGRYNIAFCDGHIESLKHEKLYEQTDTSLRRWNRNHEPRP